MTREQALIVSTLKMTDKAAKRAAHGWHVLNAPVPTDRRTSVLNALSLAHAALSSVPVESPQAYLALERISDCIATLYAAVDSQLANP